jgi:hypothetical protein
VPLDHNLLPHRRLEAAEAGERRGVVSRQARERLAGITGWRPRMVDAVDAVSKTENFGRRIGGVATRAGLGEIAAAGVASLEIGENERFKRQNDFGRINVATKIAVKSVYFQCVRIYVAKSPYTFDFTVINFRRWLDASVRERRLSVVNTYIYRLIKLPKDGEQIFTHMNTLRPCDIYDKIKQAIDLIDIFEFWPMRPNAT